MGIAYTNGPITYQSVRGDTPAHLIADLYGALVSVNWSPAVITGGYIFTITSPQGLACKVKVYNTGDSHVLIQFVSLDGALVGYAHKLDTNATYNGIGYKLWANQCGLFIALHGITNQTLSIFERNYTVAGAIPFVADSIGACAASAGSDTTSQAFWSCGQEGNEDFRTSRFCSGSYTTCWDSTLRIVTGSSDSPSTGTLQLYPFTMTENVDLWYRTLPRILKYGSGDPLHLEPYIGWNFAIRGQLWDAFLMSRDEVLEQILTDGDLSWLAWNYELFLGGRGGGGTYFGTLYLLLQETGSVGSAAGVVNYAY